MSEWWDKNRDELGKAILQWGALGMLGILASAWVGIWRLEEHIADEYKAAYWITTIAFSLLLPIACVVAYYFLFVKSRPIEDMPLPPTEAEMYPLSLEARHILTETAKNQHVNIGFLVSRCMGYIGNIYSTNNGVIICDGKDAITSARYDDGLEQLLQAEYVRRVADGAYRLTSRGIDRGQLLALATYPN